MPPRPSGFALLFATLLPPASDAIDFETVPVPLAALGAGALALAWTAWRRARSQC